MPIGKVALTGALGVLGQQLMKTWPEAQWIPIASDVRDSKVIAQEIAQANPDAVIHLAAIVSTKQVFQNPYEAFDVNVRGTFHVLEAAAALSQKPWFFFASSSHVYPFSHSALSEETSPEPQSIYGLTKHQAEAWVQLVGKTRGLKTCIGRIFSYSGITQSQDFLIPSLAQKVKQAAVGSSLTIPGLSDVRDFLPAWKVTQAIRLLAEKQEMGIFNIASGRGRQIRAIAEEIAALGSRNDLRFESQAANTNHAQTHVADTSKLRSIGFNPDYDFSAWLREMILT